MRARDVLWAVFWGFVVGSITFVVDPQNVARVLLLGLIASGLALFVTWPPIASHFPSVSLEKGDGVAVRIRRPTYRGKRALRRETRQLVKEIHEYVERMPTVAVSLSEHRKAWEAMSKADNETEKNRIWSEYGERTAEEWEHERRDLKSRFGGRMGALLREYESRGMLTRSEMNKMEWQAGSAHWMVDAAATLEALALRL